MSDTPGPRFFADASHQKSIYAHLRSDPQQPEGGGSGGSNRSGTLPNSPESPEQNNSGASSAREVASQLIELSTSRFVGDLSPESIFIEAASKIARDPSRRNPSDIGTWLPARRSDEERDARREQSASTQGHEPAGSNRADDGPISVRTLSGRVAASPTSPENHVDGPQSQYVLRVFHFMKSLCSRLALCIIDSRQTSPLRRQARKVSQHTVTVSHFHQRYSMCCRKLTL